MECVQSENLVVRLVTTMGDAVVIGVFNRMYIRVFYGRVLSDIQYDETKSANKNFHSYPISRISYQTSTFRLFQTYHHQQAHQHEDQLEVHG